MDDQQGDICRVCRCEAQSDRPLFYPCICTGSIKYIHQDCLMQWMRYSHKEYCELCGHRFSFQPIYSPDMPKILPVRVVVGGLLAAALKAGKYWLHYTLVGLAWFGIVPLSAYRTYRFMFSGSSFDMILALPFNVFSAENVVTDACRGCFVVACTMLSFIGLVWLREKITQGGGPDWLERDGPVANNEVEQFPNENAEVNAADENEEPAAEAEDIVQIVADIVEPGVPGLDAAARNDAENNQNENNNQQQPQHQDAPVDMPMNNAVPAAANPADNEGEAPLGFGGLPPLNARLNFADVIGAAAEPNAAVDANVNADDQNNAMDWDRAEELTWERLLGLDGSMVFLEHVFWIISLNTMFIFTFAFCPYCIGNTVITRLGFLEPESPLLHFHGLLTTLFGYCNIGLILVVLHYFARVFKMNRVRWLLGLCYIVVKVSLLSVLELGVLPLMCGWWLDICSLPLFDASLKDRQQNFHAAPGASLFIHWMLGMIYVYYFAAFITLLRDVLRPGVLWFLRNLNDPDFSPIQEMIHLPILRHIRRLIASAMMFGFTIILILWMPIKAIKQVWPGFLPYTLSGDSEINEISMELLLLQVYLLPQVLLPGFFEQTHSRIWLKAFLRIWCIFVSWLLGLRDYLLGKSENDEENADANAEPAAADDDNPPPAQAAAPAAAAAAAPAPAPDLPAVDNLAAAHQAFLQRQFPIGYQPYEKPNFFTLRLICLMVLMCITLVIAAFVMLTLPIWIGRHVMIFWNYGVETLPNQGTPKSTESTGRPHELYSAAIGLYFCWMVSRCISLAVNLLPQGRAAIVNKLHGWLKVAARYALPVAVCTLLLTGVPMLFGILLEQMLIIPLRVPLYQTPIHSLPLDWALGVFYTKISVAVTLMGPDWRIKRALDRAYGDGLRDMDVKFLIRELAVPLFSAFGLALAVPYIIAESVIPWLVEDPSKQLEFARTMYPTLLILVTGIAIINFNIRQFRKMYVAIKVDKYLVGQRLVNYENRKRRQNAAANGEVDANDVAADLDANFENIVAVVAGGHVPLAGGALLPIEQEERREQRDDQQREAQINHILMGDQLL